MIGQIIAGIAAIALAAAGGCQPTTTAPKDDSTIKPGTKKVNPIFMGPTGLKRITAKNHPKIKALITGKNCKWMIYYAIPHPKDDYNKVELEKGNPPANSITTVDLGRKYNFSYTDTVTGKRVDMKHTRGTHFDSSQCDSWRKK